MADSPAHVEIDLATQQPIEIGDFVGVFASISSQYERFIQAHYPDLKQDARIFVTELRPGSIHADLLLLVTSQLLPVADDIRRAVVSKFVGYLFDRIAAYFNAGGRVPDATKSDLKDFLGTVQAIATDPDGKLEMAVFEDGVKDQRVALKFNTQQARQARLQIEEHKRELDARTSADYERVLMTFTQANIKDIKLGKRTGERVKIESLSDRDLGLIYASNLAEERIKHEIREAEDNSFKKGFIVDVNIDLKDGKPAAYRVTNFHNVIDLPD
ncbi:MAG: hypothetical protein L0210_05130 [Rhodospirillales bacterium]|nr:hypothetical protein [Rhodospirillales bacterium]